MTGKKHWRGLRRGLAWAVVVATVQALALPAMTMEQEPICGIQEHQHGDVCSSMVETLCCKEEVHTHEESCYDGQGMLLCGQADYLIHSHGTFCFGKDGSLVCLLPEIPLHTHTEDCRNPEDAEQLLCGLEEQVLHTHGEDCYTEGALSCEKEQLLTHDHAEGCLEERSVLTCSLEEHVHQEACFPEKQAVEETTAPPTETLPTETQAAALLSEQEEREPQNLYTPDAREDDVQTVVGEGIRFRLFNYSLDINKDAGGTVWRPISDYFVFRNSQLKKGDAPSADVHIPTDSLNAEHDADGFPAAHATVERTLQTGMPVLDLTRNADGTAREDPGVAPDARSLAYLFSDTGDHAVTAYAPENTILQHSGNRYWYNSRDHAVDYDIDANRFRVRSYAERNSTTAGYGTGYGDFLPFDYTGGVEIQQETEEISYHLNTEDADYWFGMSMEVDFYQSKDGILGNENMVFRFSGDDDVWVFVDDVLVLDLGGTHGTVDGTIDFATGDILQYLSWNGANTGEKDRTDGSNTSFPTTLRACFDAAGRTPNGGWDESGATFADYTKHRLTFFYLERGAAVANCKIDFSLPTLPDKSLTVTKELTGAGELQDFLSRQLAYRFRVVKPDGDTFLPPGTAYTLLENGAAVGSGKTGTDGTFSLYPGQSAQFVRMLEKGGGETSYSVQELMPDNLTGQYSGVEYSVNGTGGMTQTGEGPEIAFTAFETETLSAEESQIVTFQNRVDTSRLCKLKLTKQQEAGSVFPEDMVFPLQVSLGGVLLPAGSRYQIDDRIYQVTEPGIVELQIGQTALLLEEILSGTDYMVTELGTQEGNYRAGYSGTVTPEGSVTCTAEAATGTFPLGSEVHITVTNASFDYALRIPLRKQAVFNGERHTFVFRIQEVFPGGEGQWTQGEALPGTRITVTDDTETEGSLQLGFKYGDAGDFYYRISEEKGTGPFLYDDTYYIVRVTAGDGQAAVTAVWKNGTEELPPDTAPRFVNHRTTSLSVTKRAVGGDPGEVFSFTAEVLWQGRRYPLTVSHGMILTQENQIQFVLQRDETIVLTGIPWGAEVTVTEQAHPYYIPSVRVEPLDSADCEGNCITVPINQENLTVHFTNISAYQLPQTGGGGTKLYTWAGLLQITAAAGLLYFQKKRDRNTT